MNEVKVPNYWQKVTKARVAKIVRMYNEGPFRYGGGV
jgi:hypothetical protein